MPMLAATFNAWPATTAGAPSAAITFSAIWPADCGCATSESRIKNSSPPWRLTVSAARTEFDRRSATSFSAASPTA